MAGNMYFAKRIREMRKERKESQSFVASLVGYQKQAVSHWENSGKVPRANALKFLAEYYNVSTDYLLGVANASTQESSEKKKADTVDEMSADEKDLVKKYRILDEEGKGTVRKVTETLASFKTGQSQEEIKKP